MYPERERETSLFMFGMIIGISNTDESIDLRFGISDPYYLKQKFRRAI